MAITTQAQITETGTKVGINNTSPDASLDVQAGSGTILELKAAGGWIAPLGEGTSPAVWTTPNFAFRVMEQGTNFEGQPPASFSSTFTIQPNGKTQIGYFPANPGELLSIAGSFALYHNANDWAKLRYPGGSGELRWKSTQGRSFSIVNDNSGTKGFTMAPNGKVGIGTDDFSENYTEAYQVFIQGGTLIKEGSSAHSLYVEGTMVTEELFAKLRGNWPDYVFTSGYHLIPLNELGTYIHTHGRLPGMPSAAQVAAEGIAVGETQRLLTEKVEELTLYLLQMSEEMQALREEITPLRGEK